MEDIRELIEREVGSWDGVTTHSIRDDRIEFRLGTKVFGQLDDEGWADLPFTTRIREMLVGTGRARSSRRAGWVTHEPDLEVVELFRLSYERALVAQNVRASRDQLGEAGSADVPAGDDDSDPAA